ncbi:hypothetical protein VTK73DRAFT_5982 [Phialemonium thermophilum]|uniref:Uncharacterized protein n=1 Tax=Phialemonium thermophilum TaxID=223376 RepID=A0ABR3V0F3_9PEZI
MHIGHITHVRLGMSSGGSSQRHFLGLYHTADFLRSRSTTLGKGSESRRCSLSVSLAFYIYGFGLSFASLAFLGCYGCTPLGSTLSVGTLGKEETHCMISIDLGGMA